jgi:hypothetical protein
MFHVKNHISIFSIKISKRKLQSIFMPSIKQSTTKKKFAHAFDQRLYLHDLSDEHRVLFQMFYDHVREKENISF